MKDTESAGMGNIYISSEQIIQEVQKYRCIYDPDDPDHKDRDVLRDAWLSVTQAVVGEAWANLNSAEKNEAASEITRKWKNIKDSLRRSLKRSGKPGGRPYAFQNELNFLLEVDCFRNSDLDDNNAGADGRKYRLLRPKRNTSAVNYFEDTSATFEADELSETSDSQPGTRSPRPKRKRNRPQQIVQDTQRDNSFVGDQSVSVTCTPEFNSFSGVNYPGYQSACMPEPENPDRMFLLSLLPKVSALSSRDKLDFQIKAIQLLREYEKDDSNS